MRQKPHRAFLLLSCVIKHSGLFFFSRLRDIKKNKNSPVARMAHRCAHVPPTSGRDISAISQHTPHVTTHREFIGVRVRALRVLSERLDDRGRDEPRGNEGLAVGGDGASDTHQITAGTIIPVEAHRPRGKVAFAALLYQAYKNAPKLTSLFLHHSRHGNGKRLCLC